jgi:hypothetical protein
MARLTKPQQQLLDEVQTKGHVRCSSSYRPARALIDLGLVQSATLPFGRVLLVNESEGARDGKS